MPSYLRRGSGRNGTHSWCEKREQTHSLHNQHTANNTPTSCTVTTPRTINPQAALSPHSGQYTHNLHYHHTADNTPTSCTKFYIADNTPTICIITTQRTINPQAALSVYHHTADNRPSRCTIFIWQCEPFKYSINRGGAAHTHKTVFARKSDLFNAELFPERY